MESELYKILREMKEHATELNTQSLQDNSRLAPSQVATILNMYVLRLRDVI